MIGLTERQHVLLDHFLRLAGGDGEVVRDVIQKLNAQGNPPTPQQIVSGILQRRLEVK